MPIRALFVIGLVYALMASAHAQEEMPPPEEAPVEEVPTAAPPTPSPAPSPVPTPVVGGVFLSDNFDDPTVGVLARSSTRLNEVSEYANGAYRMIRAEPGPDSVIRSVPGTYSDVTVSTEVRLTLSSDPAKQSAFVICRMQSDGSNYAGSINGNGFAGLNRWDRGPGTTNLGSRRIIPAGQTLNSAVHLELTCLGDSFILRANDSLVVAVRDQKYANGQVALGVYGNQVPSEAAFDNLVLSRPDPSGPHAPLAVTEERPPSHLTGAIFRPSQQGARHPGVLVLHGSEGYDAGGTRAYARRLAGEGFVTFALCYYRCAGQPGEILEIALEYVSGAVEALRTRDDVIPDQVSVLGHSRGGELALLLGSEFRNIRSVISFAGSGVVYASYPGFTGSAWAFGGRRFTQGTQIAVERIEGPVLLFVGQRDDVWSWSLSQDIADRLGAANRPFELVVFPDAGHYLTSAACVDFPEACRTGSTASRPAFYKTVEFLRAQAPSR